ncbi:MAG: twin arginine-targeting protein translocase TatC [Deltaproteobacteria bacterium RIFOXYA12_FULL_58_15]|nr:MAG: twin arginine-targeting protein translocase TatC [Deltaproteobacteria bacterium RIFOXYA12_FULL_58_15]OGR07157.1 MAG: twin arginine-targeting protein translocase TatC [Deltaproteobacteria bacterium RIFOXYB12_FULL_58_9]
MTDQDAQTPEPGRMSLFEHLDELRRRLIACVVVMGVCTIVLFSLAPNLFKYLRRPLDAIAANGLMQLQVLSPLEMFLTYLKLAVLGALFVSAPWILLQVWMFVSPGLYKNEKRWILPFVFLGTAFFIGGAAFGYFLVLPLGFDYLVSFTPAEVTNAWSVEKYFSIVTRLLLGFGVVFEVPLLMWILSAAGIVQPKSFSKFRKYWIVLAWIIGAILTPPDPFTQAMMAVPLMIFFEVGLLGGRLLYRRRQDAAFK